MKSLEAVLKRLLEAGLRMRNGKCLFLVSSVEFLGHKIDSTGLHPLSDKLEAIVAAPTPSTVTELKAYLGLLTYYGKFLSNLSARLAPLYQLLKKDVVWEWTPARDKTFMESKRLLSSESLLVHFDSTVPLTLECDASAYGIGAVLAHRFPDGSERPIGYASRTLNEAEPNYSQLEKEVLFGFWVSRSSMSICLESLLSSVTDRQLLLGLLKEGRPTSPQASARIRRWSLYLSIFEYTLKFRRTTAHANADPLSRLPLPVEPAVVVTPLELVQLTEHLSNSPISADQIRTQTRKDPVLGPTLQYLEQGWPATMDKVSPLYPMFPRRAELSLFEGCVLWGTRVVIPSDHREAVLTELHDSHPGIHV